MLLDDGNRIIIPEGNFKFLAPYRLNILGKCLKISISPAWIAFEQKKFIASYIFGRTYFMSRVPEISDPRTCHAIVSTRWSGYQPRYLATRSISQCFLGYKSSLWLSPGRYPDS